MLTLIESNIDYVMNVCSCSKRDAVDLLRHSNNDPKQAQRRHQMKLQFGWVTPNSLSPRSEQPHIQDQRPKSRDDDQCISNILGSDDYDVISLTSDQEVFSNSIPASQPQNEAEGLSALPTRPGINAKTSDQDDNRKLTGLFGALEKYDAGGKLLRVPSKPTPSQSPGPDTMNTPEVFEHKSSPVDNGAGKSSPVIIPIDTMTQEILKDSAKDVAESDTGDMTFTTNQTGVVLNDFEWDFHLPTVSLNSGVAQHKTMTRFSAYDLVALIQRNADEVALQAYFECHDGNVIQSKINQEVNGFPVIFYAAAANNDRILRSCIAYGADVNAVHSKSGVPVLAFAIVHSETIEEDTTDIVASLLSLGASAHAIAEPFYKPYSNDLSEDGPSDEELESCQPGQKSWLHPSTKQKLARNLNLTHRYNLERASRTPKPSARHKQVSERYRAEGLLGLPYFLIGQSLATNRLLQTCINHLANRTQRPKPLVLVFAGPSGHGKTELARKLGYLMSLELEVVDCTTVTREIELFGGRHPYVNAGEGAPLNNFLSKHSGQRSIVFMDEFEKTTKDIHQALLLPFDNGEYSDRRNGKKIDCSKTIWILATNALDNRIRNFCQRNEVVLFNSENEEQRKRLMKDLDKDLKKEFLSKFEAPVTGRISAFLPFLLFSPAEQAVIAHKYLLELGRDVRKPVNLTKGAEERLIGNVRLHIKRDASVCSHLAEDGYHPELGARSLITAVDNVRHLLVDAYLSVDEAIREAEELVDFVVDIQGGNIVAELFS